MAFKAKQRQVTAGLIGDGDIDYASMSKLGQLYTADWKNYLVANGRIYNAHIGTLTAGADVGLIVGGGNGTTVDSDQPEMIIGVDAGYYLVPIDIKVICDVDIDANDEYGEILIFADRTAAPPTSATGTPGVVTPVNALDGGAAFPGRCFGGVTTDITDPVMDEFLDLAYVNGAEFVSNGSATNLTNGIVYSLSRHYAPDYPEYLAGPCSIVICFGGTAAVNGMIACKVGVVPASWFPVS